MDSQRIIRNAVNTLVQYICKLRWKEQLKRTIGAHRTAGAGVIFVCRKPKGNYEEATGANK